MRTTYGRVRGEGGRSTAGNRAMCNVWDEVGCQDIIRVFFVFFCLFINYSHLT